MNLDVELSASRVAIIHYWLVNHGGGERVLDAIAGMFPQADIFAVVADPTTLSPEIRRHRLTTSALQKLPGSTRYHRHFLPLYPLALESFDLSGYDLVISHESGPAKGVITRPDTCHVCYCSSPMRYLWDMYPEYRNRMGVATRLLFSATSNRMRLWDFSSASRVDYFAANSHFVAARIRKYYRRESAVIHPPVEIPDAPPSASQDYFLIVSRLTDYKRVDLAVDAFNHIGWPLRIVGDGPLLRFLQKRARPNITFLGRMSNAEIREQYASCRALVFPGQEDFGIVPVEAQAFGKPVIAFGSGGALDSVIPVQPGTPPEFATGIFFHPQASDSLISALQQFRLCESKFRSEFIRSHAQRFRPEAFRSRFSEFVSTSVAQHRTQISRQAWPWEVPA